MSSKDKDADLTDQVRVREAIKQLDSLPQSLREALLNRLDASDELTSYADSQRGEHAQPSRGVKEGKRVKGVRRAINSLRVSPGEVIGKVSQRVEELRAEGVEQVRSEVKRLVERVDLQSELVKLLSQLSIELKTTIKLEPKAESQFGVKPKVVTEAKLRWGDEVTPSDEATQENRANGMDDSSPTGTLKSESTNQEG